METAVGGLIRKARERRGLSQTKAGRLLRMSEQFLGRIEAGSPLPFPRVKKIQKVLGIKTKPLIQAYVTDYAIKVNRALNAKKR